MLPKKKNITAPKKEGQKSDNRAESVTISEDRENYLSLSIGLKNNGKSVYEDGIINALVVGKARISLKSTSSPYLKKNAQEQYLLICSHSADTVIMENISQSVKDCKRSENILTACKHNRCNIGDIRDAKDNQRIHP